MHNCDRTCRATVRQLRIAVRIGLLGVPHRQPEERGLRTTEIAELMTRAARRRDGSPRFTIRPIRQKLAGTPPNSRRTPAGNAPRDCLSAAMRLAGGQSSSPGGPGPVLDHRSAVAEACLFGHLPPAWAFFKGRREKRQQPLGIPLPHRRTGLPVQRPAHVPRGSEAGGC